MKAGTEKQGPLLYLTAQSYIILCMRYSAVKMRRMHMKVDRIRFFAVCFAAVFFLFCAKAEPVSVMGKVIEIEKYGHALLDIRAEDFDQAGFDLGDVVTVSAGSYTGDMPFFNGYYVKRGETMLRAYPGHENIAVCVNYGKFNELAGIGVGDEVIITLKEKAGAIVLQEINNLVYTNERSDYASDEIFANFRPVIMGQIRQDTLYRSCSPVNNENNRAATADSLIAGAGVRTVMNLADTPEEIESYFGDADFASPWYKALYDDGNVIALAMPVNYTSDHFAEGIVEGLVFLSEHESPYLVHCTEGKDRAGFVCLLTEMLMGAELEDILQDYMLSYVNYYGIEPGTDKYQMIMENNAIDMIRAIAGAEKDTELESIDLSCAAHDYLVSHGMTEEAIDTLKSRLK